MLYESFIAKHNISNKTSRLTNCTKTMFEAEKVKRWLSDRNSSGLTHRSVHLQENGPKVSFVEVQVNSCKTKATVIRKTLLRSNSRAYGQNKNNRTDETSGWLVSPKSSSSLFSRWSRVFCLGVYSNSTHALAQHLHVHMSHSVHRTTKTGIVCWKHFFALISRQKIGLDKKKLHESNPERIHQKTKIVWKQCGEKKYLSSQADPVLKGKTTTYKENFKFGDIFCKIKIVRWF